MPEVAELIKLKNLQCNFENSQGQFLEIWSKQDAAFHDFLVKLNNESSNECSSIREQILTIQSKQQELQAKIQNLDVNDTLDPLKLELIELKDSIENFKVFAQRRLDDLRSEELNLSDELQYYEQMFEKWSKPIDDIKEPFSFIKRSTLNKIECPEVKELDKFLQDNQGQTNGWTDEDHAVFLKIKQKYPNIETTAEKVNKLFPDKSVDDIRAHYLWHEKYCELRNKQKEAIKHWKIHKQNEQTVKCNENAASLTPSPIATKQNKYRIFKVNTEDTRAKLQAWKEEKRRRQEQQTYVQEMSEQFQKQLDIMKMQKKSETKEKVDHWRAIKSAENRAIELKRREEELKVRTFKSLLANHFIKDFQTQDKRYIARMQNSKTKPDGNKTMARNGKVLVNRDPQRLFKPTQTWIYKTAKNSAKEEKTIQTLGLGNCNLNLNSIQKLKAPDWRK